MLTSILYLKTAYRLYFRYTLSIYLYISTSIYLSFYLHTYTQTDCAMAFIKDIQGKSSYAYVFDGKLYFSQEEE